MHANLQTGATIHSMDGKDLGKVKEIRGDIFKVDAAMAPDYWLSCESLAEGQSVSDVYVRFTKDRLDEYKVAEPAGA